MSLQGGYAFHASARSERFDILEPLAPLLGVLTHLYSAKLNTHVSDIIHVQLALHPKPAGPVVPLLFRCRQVSIPEPSWRRHLVIR